MKKETIEALIAKLDKIIALFEQTIALSWRIEEEHKACELLKDARLRLVEALGEKKQE
jgi:hypothetical protein